MVLFRLAEKLLSSVDMLIQEGQYSKLKAEVQYWLKLSVSLFSAETEIWHFGYGNNKVISPSIPSGYFAYGPGIYSVEFDFCHKNY